ncbi:hypothetical protein K443DRAFT_445901 [Laccaria amethystina LaAM-08-1]|uniref:Uncharacterized protein n=1 Tax=Laccaria amethystina LaAM-08-1 TaxID=1095629 RepID=A0A0C9XVM5_9AGAR|nr:hypothetical protein K443DRAFT_445901 [Laccaria amethystina LaAM-08-1]
MNNHCCRRRRETSHLYRAWVFWPQTVYLTDALTMGGVVVVVYCGHLCRCPVLEWARFIEFFSCRWSFVHVGDGSMPRSSSTVNVGSCDGEFSVFLVGILVTKGHTSCEVSLTLFAFLDAVFDTLDFLDSRCPFLHWVSLQLLLGVFKPILLRLGEAHVCLHASLACPFQFRKLLL